MELDPLKIQVASSITTRFLNLRQPSPRKPLALLVRDGGVLDEMELRTLVRAEKNRTEYFPTLGTFAILGDDDERYLKARLGAIQVLHTLIDLYEARDTSEPYTREEFIEQVRARYDSADPDGIGLGLYVVVTEFGVIQSFGRSQDGTQIATFMIAEQVLKITNPESAWTQRVVISRNNASAPAHSFESAAKLQFVDKVSEIYEPVLEKHRTLEQQYANAGIAEGGNFARLATDAVLNAFREVEHAFRSVYFDPFKGRGLEPELNGRLAAILEETMTEETTRAKGVAQNLCLSFIGPRSDRSQAIVDRVQSAGAKMKGRLGNVLTLLVMQDLHLDVSPESGPDSGSMTSTGPSPSSSHPQVFISYAWESEALQQWVLKFATRLRENGVDVTLDQWHLDYGDDRLHFMERSVVSAGFVLIICTPHYAEKSDDRAGGVGYESNIITSRIAEKTDRQKFIPVLRSGDWKTSVPAWLKHVAGCNLTTEPFSEAEFRNLLKTLHRRRPNAPALGPAPSFEDNPVSEEPATVTVTTPAMPPLRLNLKEDLDIKEHELLDAAVNDPNGQISHRRPIGHDLLMANDKSFLEPGRRRENAAWMAALGSLEQRGLIQPASAERHFYFATDRGYKLAEKLGKFVRWKTAEVLLEARYLKGSNESLSINCTGVVEVPPTFYADNEAADGAVMRSLKQNRSLWVEGVDPSVIDGIQWQPTDVSFRHTESNDTMQFHIRLRPSIETGTMLLEIAG